MFYDVTLAELSGVLAFLISFAPFIVCLVLMIRLWYRFEKLEKQAIYRQEDLGMVFKCLRGCLEGLVHTGANGPVVETLSELNDYIDKKAAGLHGK